MFSSISSATFHGVSGTVIRVEVHTSSGFPGYTVVGMPDTAMRESKERIRSALLSSGIGWPQSRITINLAPANVRKSGTGAELAILVGLLCSTKILDPKRFYNVGVIGELGLDGAIRQVSGTIARVLALKKSGIEQVFVPLENAHEASLVDGIEVFGIESVGNLVRHLTEGLPWPDIPDNKKLSFASKRIGDYQDIVAQPLGCEAMMICAAGGHHTLLMGSPGIGKTMLAERIPSISSKLTREQSQEVTAINSILDGKVSRLAIERPFRQPHHSASVASLVGGGSHVINPGEATRAHHGFLFLDELSEFSINSLESLRQPLESGIISISRANYHTKLPAHFTLIACSNSCPCAKPREKCICSDSLRSKYLRKLSGPLLDRFDIRLELFRSDFLEGKTHSSSEMKSRVKNASQRQLSRNSEFGITCNAQLSSPILKEYFVLKDGLDLYLKEHIEKREISGRGATAIWRVARTIADLNDVNDINELHLSQAFDLREEII